MQEPLGIWLALQPSHTSCASMSPAVLVPLCPGPPRKAPAAIHQKGPGPSKCPFPDMLATSVMCEFSTMPGVGLQRVCPSELARWSGEPPSEAEVRSPSWFKDGGWAGVQGPRDNPPPPPPTSPDPMELTQGMERKTVIKVRAQLGDGVHWRLGGGSKVGKRADPAMPSAPKSGTAVQGQWGPFRWELQHGGSLPPGAPIPRLPSLQPPGQPLPALPRTGHATPRPTRTGHTSRDLTKPQWNFRTWR